MLSHAYLPRRITQKGKKEKERKRPWGINSSNWHEYPYIAPLTFPCLVKKEYYPPLQLVRVKQSQFPVGSTSDFILVRPVPCNSLTTFQNFGMSKGVLFPV